MCASRGSGLVVRFAGVRPCVRFSGEGTATKVRRATWTVYDDANHQVRTAQGYATGAQWDTFTFIEPVSITNFDEAGNLLEEIQGVRGSTSGETN